MTGPLTDAALDRDARLAELADAIKSRHLAMQGSAGSMISEAVAIGKALIEAKRLVRHGEWLPYVERTCRVGARMAQHYMRLAREVGESETRFVFNGESIRSAIQRLRVKEPRPVIADTWEEQKEAYREEEPEPIIFDLGPLRVLIDLIFDVRRGLRDFDELVCEAELLDERVTEGERQVALALDSWDSQSNGGPMTEQAEEGRR